MTREEAISAIQSNRQTSGYTMLCDALDMAVAALREQEERRWIPVTERLPSEKELEESERCGFLCRIVIPVVGGKTQEETRIVYYDILDKMWKCDGIIITHWMPLPKPPKEADR